MIHSIDTATFSNTNISKLFDVISDFSTYKYWWPKYIKFNRLKVSPDILYSRVYVSPFMSPGFLWRITNLIENEILEVTYEYGAYTGKGIWEVKKNNEEIELSYEINLLISNSFIKLTSNFINIESMHKKLMKNVFKKLDIYLSNKL
jgi:ribosome-associated toxin RatA of RatAB toxin-antitoxin module